MKFIAHVFGVSLSLWLVDWLMSSISFDSLKVTILAAVVLIIMNSIVKPILTLLTLPVTILTLGLFLFVVNALTYWWTASLIDGFHIQNFMSAIIGAFLTSVISSFIQNFE